MVTVCGVLYVVAVELHQTDVQAAYPVLDLSNGCSNRLQTTDLLWD